MSTTVFTDGRQVSKSDFNATELALFRNVQPVCAVRC
jgi:hypothetical protein